MHSTQPYSADDYMQSFQAGKEKGFDYFFRALYKQLFFYARCYMRNDIPAAEDIVSNAFVVAWQNRQNIRNPKMLKDYLYKVVRHDCLDQLAKKQTRVRHSGPVAYQAETIQESCLNNIAHAEFIVEVYRALHSLPPACRTIFTKLYIEGKSVNETAAELGLARNTVYAQKDRGIGIIKKRLKLKVQA